MSNIEIITTLKQERTQLIESVKSGQKRITDLDTAISALEGRANPNRDGLSVPDMIEAAARELCQQVKEPMQRIFDRKELVKVAVEKWPMHEDRIRRGVYPATDQLKKRKVLELAPGGFRLAP